MSQSVEVLPVPKGSIVLLVDIEIPAGDIDPFVTALRKDVGHSEFAVVQIREGGKVRIITAPDELIELIREAIGEE